MNASTPVVYAFALGLVAALNPCGFPLLPAYLALFVENELRQPWAARVSRALIAGACITLGFIGVFAVTGIPLAAGAHFILEGAPWFMIFIGAALFLVGSAGVFRRTLRLPLPTLRFAAGRSSAAMIGFGAAYAVGSLSCALPLFVAGVATSATTPGLAGLIGFIAYGLGMGLFVTAASVVASLFGAASLRRVRTLTRVVPIVTSIIVAVVGLYLILYWTTELMTPGSAGVLISALQTVPASVGAWLAGAPIVTGGVLTAIVFAGLITVAIHRSTCRTPNPPEGKND